MADIVDPVTRSRMMSRVRSRNTKPELRIRRLLHGAGFRFRVKAPKQRVQALPGRPDVKLTRWKTVVFVHGCFWHAHGCSLFRYPAQNETFWRDKLESNHNRDQRVLAALHELGWRTVVVWECAMRGKGRWQDDELAEDMQTFIRGANLHHEIGEHPGDDVWLSSDSSSQGLRRKDWSQLR